MQARTCTLAIVLIAGITFSRASMGTQNVPVYRIMAAGETAVKSTLRDPDSARFRDVYVSRLGKGYVVCGAVNFKNGFGGYMGYQQFVSAGTARGTFFAPQARDWAAIWSRACSHRIAP